MISWSSNILLEKNIYHEEIYFSSVEAGSWVSNSMAATNDWTIANLQFSRTGVIPLTAFYCWSEFCQIWIIFTHLKLWIAWVKKTSSGWTFQINNLEVKLRVKVKRADFSHCKHFQSFPRDTISYWYRKLSKRQQFDSAPVQCKM